MRTEPASLALAAALAAFGCAPRQTIPLDCVPREMTIYVDGEALEQVPPSLALRTDADHKIMFKGGGYETRFIALATRESEEGDELAPADICTELRFVKVKKELEIEVERGRP
jgi:hypothetical protein